MKTRIYIYDKFITTQTALINVELVESQFSLTPTIYFLQSHFFSPIIYMCVLIFVVVVVIFYLQANRVVSLSVYKTDIHRKIQLSTI